jgi:small-conductance mechanosensitive channel
VRRTVKLAAVFLVACICVSALAPRTGLAQTEPPVIATQEDSSPRVWIENLDTIEDLIESDRAADPQMAEAVKALIQEIIAEARDNLARDRKRSGPLKAQMQTLGPGPAEGEPPESEELASIRRQLTEIRSEVEGRIKATELVISKANILLGRITGTVRAEFSQVLDRSPSLFSSETWRAADEGLKTIAATFARAPGEWWRGATSRYRILQLVMLGLAALIAYPLAAAIRRRLGHHIRLQESKIEPTASSRILVDCVRAIRQVFVPLIALGLMLMVIVMVMDTVVALPYLLRALCYSGMIYVLVWGLADSVLSPDQPDWRLLPVTEEGAVVLARRLKVIGAYLAFTMLLRELSGFGGAPPKELVAVADFTLNTILAGLLLTLTPQRFWKVADEGPVALWFALGRLFIISILMAVPVIDLMGFSHLASLILRIVTLTVLFLGLGWLLRAGAVELLHQACQPSGRFYGGLNDRFRLSEGTLGIIEIWISILVQVFIFGPIIYFLLISYGLEPEVLNGWLNQLVTGIHIGDFTISLVDIIVGIAVFAFSILMSGWIKRWLSNKLMKRTRMDSGARNSIVSGVGYTVIIIGALMAVATLGLDFSKLAIVAGALSVGIGFGLRTVVENFVSGLLLLIERPVKVGDWIVVGSVEGTVKRISVRSTEIETFDRSSVIVPNSDLISQSVKNWTHKNRTIRISIPVGVAYGSDTERVHDLLLECAKSTPHVLSYPEPRVLFMAFGDSSLDFQLRVFAQDTDYYITVLSALHFAIDASFRENGITIPFPQRDVHIIAPDDGKTAESVSASGEDGTEERSADPEGSKGSRPSGSQA